MDDESKQLSIDLKQLRATAYQLKIIPGCEYIDLDYDWSPIQDDNPDLYREYIDDLKRDIRKRVSKWIHSTSEKNILRITRYLHIEARKTLVNVLPMKYKGFFRPPEWQYPYTLATSNPFLVLNKNKGSFVQIKQPIIRRYGKTMMVISGKALLSQDQLTLLALLQIHKRKKCSMDTPYLIFDTSYIEIANELGKNQPASKSTREAIWKSLVRLKKAKIEITGAVDNEIIKRRLNGILKNESEINKNEKSIKIMLDTEILNMLFMKNDINYVQLDDPETFVNLSPTAMNLYLYLMRQQNINEQFGVYRIGIPKICEHTGIGGLSDKISWRTLRNGLMELKQCGIRYQVMDNRLSIKRRVVINNQKSKSALAENDIKLDEDID